MSEKTACVGGKPYSYIYFCLSSDVHFDPRIITEKLMLEPTSIKIKGHPTPKQTSWRYEIKVESSPDLETPTNSIVHLLKSRTEEINMLRHRYRLDASLNFKVDIDINAGIPTPYFPLDRATIKLLNDISASVDFDIYKVDSKDLRLK